MKKLMFRRLAASSLRVFTLLLTLDVYWSLHWSLIIGVLDVS